MIRSEFSWITANWPVPDYVKAGTTCRINGNSTGNYAENNLAQHVGDDLQVVEENRQKLIEDLSVLKPVHWLKQVHANKIINLDKKYVSNVADGSTTTKIGTVCAVLTADCLPLLLCNPEIPRVSAVHVGWRGFCQGVVAKALEDYQELSDNTFAWIGPCISAGHYEVGGDMYESCISYLAEVKSAFEQIDAKHWHADLAEFVRIELANAGLTRVYGNEHCTYSRDDLFYSYRRDGVTGRMATLIWMTA